MASRTYWTPEQGRIQTEATWLMVLDNADVKEILYDWLPDQGNISL
jgi:hypothetical protein